jgi:hypothetical protein
MWVPFATMFVGLIGLPEGSYSWSELPSLARASMVVGGVLAAAAVVLLVASPLTASLTNRSVLVSGLPAEATIVEIHDTGTTINQSPVVRMILEVRPPGGSPFRAEMEQWIGRLEVSQIQPGTVVQVRYDPKSHAVALDSVPD